MATRSVSGYPRVLRSVFVPALGLLLFAGVVFGAGSARADGQQVWARQFNTSDNGGTTGTAVASDSANGHVYILVRAGGTFLSRMVTVAYSKSGAKLWTASTGEDGDLPAAITVDPATHNVFVAGTRGPNQLVQAYTAAGTRLWSKTLGSTSGRNVIPAAMTLDGHGRVIVTGRSTGGGLSDYLTVAYRVSTGAVLWHRRYDGPGHGDDTAVAVSADPGVGRVYVTGTSQSTQLVPELATVAYASSDGTQKWAVRDTGASDVAKGIAVDPTNHQVYAVCESEDSPLSMQTFALSPAGALLWHRTVAAPDNALPKAVAVDPGNGQVYVAGTDVVPGGARNVVVAYADDGTRLWTDIDTGNDELAWAITVDAANHRVYVAGEQTDTSGNLEFRTVADSAAGTRRWTQVHASPSPGGSAAPVAIAADSAHAQVYVLGFENTSGLDAAAETIAYQA